MTQSNKKILKQNLEEYVYNIVVKIITFHKTRITENIK